MFVTKLKLVMAHLGVALALFACTLFARAAWAGEPPAEGGRPAADYVALPGSVRLKPAPAYDNMPTAVRRTPVPARAYQGLPKAVEVEPWSDYDNLPQRVPVGVGLGARQPARLKAGR